MVEEYESCTCCSKNCAVNRNAGQTGFCGETDEIRVAWAGLHFGEEPPVTGKGGSGAVFITGCNLGCLFCQNYQISQDGLGTTVSMETFAEICLALQKAGAENINIVTGSHAIPAIAGALRTAQTKGLTIPALWNSSAYETTESLALLSGLVSVWLPDLKTLNPILAESIFCAADYPKAAKKAIRYMVENSPLRIDHTGSREYPSGKIQSGVIVRHLALPGRFADTELVLRWFAEHLEGKAILSLMTQYTPVPSSAHSKNLSAFPDRPLEIGEYDRLKALIEELDIEAGFYQELSTDSDWLPDFTKIQPFSSNLARPIWHYSTGFLQSDPR
jgi:putative pyruvate formate lyase activating enzyme